MEGPRVCLWFVVITLLQLCQAGHIPPRWYAAKLNDQPRPESYNNEPYFSTSKPIIVTSPSNNLVTEEFNDYMSSTLPPPSSIDFRQSSRYPSNPSTYYTSERLPSSGIKNVFVSKPTITAANTTPLPPLYEIHDNLHQMHSQRQMDLQRQHQRAFANPQIQPYVPFIAPLQQHLDVEPQLQMVSEIPTQVHRKLQVQQQIEPIGQTISPSLPVNNLFQTQTLSTLKETEETGSTFDLTSPTSTQSPPTQFVVVYDETQPTVTNFYQPPSPSQTPSSAITSQSTLSVTPSSIRSTPVEIRTTQGSSTSRFVPFTESTTTATTLVSSTQRNPTTRVLTSRVTVIPSSTTGSTVPPCNDRVSSSTQRPLSVPLGPGPLGFPLKIRVIAPTGSITNVNINPVPPTPKTTTRRPTTTRKPTTKRTSKPKKNTYERCLDGCKKVKDPICAAPLAHIEIDPKELKGFPSVCHMACHNSYKATPYEKVVDGSCGKLRTRIRPLDSRTKLKNVELVKTEYIVDQGPKTIIELTGNVRHKK